MIDIALLNVLKVQGLISDKEYRLALEKVEKEDKSDKKVSA